MVLRGQILLLLTNFWFRLKYLKNCSDCDDRDSDAHVPMICSKCADHLTFLKAPSSDQHVQHTKLRW